MTTGSDLRLTRFTHACVLLSALGRLAADRWLASSGVPDDRRLRAGETIAVD